MATPNLIRAALGAAAAVTLLSLAPRQAFAQG